MPDGVTLTIEAGVTVKFNSGLYIKNEGVITAVGTSSNKITFESSSVSPAKSDWSGIRIRPTGGSAIDGSQNYSSGSQFKYVLFKHADIGLYFMMLVYMFLILNLIQIIRSLKSEKLMGL